MIPSFDDFKSDSAAQGFDEVLVRHWTANAVVDTHVHEFDAKAVVVAGEMWLTVGDRTQHIAIGGTFEIDADTPHSERYGGEGATYWVARRTRR